MALHGLAIAQMGVAGDGDPFDPLLVALHNDTQRRHCMGGQPSPQTDIIEIRLPKMIATDYTMDI